MIPFDATTVSTITTAMTTAMSTAASDGMTAIGDIVPVIMPLVGAVMVVRIGLKLFKMLTGKV